ncbi:coiled-coil domain-containing protein 130 [Nesidiocoris tenuis]|uniref:Coiled-coil domain-containing protein 130 n=1 Tax=Nesidiocoris tenuis TaxID=355587 RepID=A0ABN7B0E2_9HEMI|nr:coiled-coil domain-containing protein 130 [Nesidiocoris tenuis]
MGERKGTNKYYPPDYDPARGGLNKFLGTHALRERARKLHMGILIIRFEMPFNIWCEGCGNHIGMGVRYNAEKKKIGMYYTTPVYQFRMKCHLCDNHFEIKTDPGNLEYVVVSGARRQENRWDPTQNGQVVPEDKEVSKRLFDDAMFKLEHGVGDKAASAAVSPAISGLLLRSDVTSKDDFGANLALRAQFRARKKELKAKEASDHALLKKSSLEIPLLAENVDDVKLAGLLKLSPVVGAQEKLKSKMKRIIDETVNMLEGPSPMKKLCNVGVRPRTNPPKVDSSAANSSGVSSEPSSSLVSLVAQYNSSSSDEN